MAHPVRVTCDSDATSLLVKLSFASKTGIPIMQTTHSVSQADGKTRLPACGEIHISPQAGSAWRIPGSSGTRQHQEH